MFEHTHTTESPWWVVEADDKRRARINCIAHLLNQIPYQEKNKEIPTLPPRPPDSDYTRPPHDDQNLVPEWV